MVLKPTMINLTTERKLNMINTVQVLPSQVKVGDKLFAYGCIFQVKEVLERNDSEGTRYHPSGKFYCCIADVIENVDRAGAFPQAWMKDFNLQGNDNRTHFKVVEA